MIYTYLRISSSELSFKNQESKLNDYCKKNNLVSKTTIYDVSEGFCESSDNNLYKLISALNINDTILMYNISRISRDANKIKKFFDICRDKKLNVMFLYNNENDSDLIGNTNELLLTIFENLTNISKEYTSHITKIGLKKLKDQGIKLGTPSTITTEKISKIFDLRSQGLSYDQIVKITGVSKGSISRILNHKIDQNEENKNTKIFPIALKLSVWADKSINIPRNEILKKYNISIDEFESIIKSLKGGGNF